MLKYIIFLILLCSAGGCTMNMKESHPPVPTAEPAIKYSGRPETIIIKAEINRSSLPIKQVVLSNIPEFCLYGDKTLIYRLEERKTSSPPAAERVNYLLMKKVTLREENIQALLKLITEEKKFLTMKSQKKKKDNISFSMTVNIEKANNSITFYNNGPKELIDIYNILKTYDMNRAEIYRPGKISLAVYNVPDYIEHCTRKATMWTCKDIINLENLSGKYTPEDIHGKNLDRLLDFFTKYSPNDYFYFQGEKVYGIFCRPYLPHEFVNDK